MRRVRGRAPGSAAWGRLGFISCWGVTGASHLTLGTVRWPDTGTRFSPRVQDGQTRQSEARGVGSPLGYREGLG